MTIQFQWDTLIRQFPLGADGMIIMDNLSPEQETVLVEKLEVIDKLKLQYKETEEQIKVLQQKLQQLLRQQQSTTTTITIPSNTTTRPLLHNNKVIPIQNDRTNNKYTSESNGTRTKTKSYCPPYSTWTWKFKLFLFILSILLGIIIWAIVSQFIGRTKILTLVRFDLNSGTSSSYPSDFTILNNKLYFSASQPDGVYLWESDGTLANTKPVFLCLPGYSGMISIRMVTFHNKLLFHVPSLTLYTSDGTASGTHGLSGGWFMPYYNKFIVENNGNKAYFLNGPSTDQLMYAAINTTDANFYTDIVFDNNYNTIQNPKSLTMMNNRLYFYSNNALWSTDSTIQGTTILYTPISINMYMTSDLYVEPFLVYHDSIIFSADVNPSSSTYGYELWAYDMINGARMIFDLFPGTGSGMCLNGRFFLFNDKVYFAGTNGDGISGCELYCTDLQNTYMVSDIAPGSTDSNPEPFAVYNNYLYLRTNNYQVNHPRQLYRTDGIQTTLVKDINVGPPMMMYTYVNNYFMVYHNKLYFMAENPNSYYTELLLWVTEGTEDKTTIVNITNSQFQYPFSPHLFTIYNDALYFTAADFLGDYELWKLSES